MLREITAPLKVVRLTDYAQITHQGIASFNRARGASYFYKSFFGKPNQQVPS